MLLIFVILGWLPVWMGAVVIVYDLLWLRASFRIDYALLFTFFAFFGFTDNLRIFLGTHLNHPKRVFLCSALASQAMSNVPATLLLADFTRSWKALLWGVNTGRFGSLVGSFANLIAYKKIYLNRNPAMPEVKRFTVKFLLWGMRRSVRP